MVVAGKIFRFSEQITLEETYNSLKDYKREDSYEENEHKFELVTEISNLALSENSISGLYAEDFVIHLVHRGKAIPVPKTMQAIFQISKCEDKLFLVVLERKRKANYVANRLSEIIYGRAGAIIEARIPPEALAEFHMKNPEGTKVVFFDNVDIPNINKLSLYGPDLKKTEYFEEYCKHGDIWYVMITSKEKGYIVGVTRDASVTIFNTNEATKYLEYVVENIFPLIP